MRSENEIKSLILNVAKKDERIRAVLLNGSRANRNIPPDNFQDYDIIFIVSEIQTFLSDHTWIDIFGKRLILQMPKEMEIGIAEDDSANFSYLMLFDDGNRIDLTLFPIEKIKEEFGFDNLSILLLDKDNLFPDLPESSDTGYLIKKPTEKEFLDCCNEFWWVSTYVAKGLWREDILYAKDMFENPVRAMFLKMIEWHVGITTHFSVSFGKSGKNAKANVTPALWTRILNTYPNAESKNIWDSLLLMAEIFKELAKYVANELQFNYNIDEGEKAMHYLMKVKASIK